MNSTETIYPHHLHRGLYRPASLAGFIVLFMLCVQAAFGQTQPCYFDPSALFPSPGDYRSDPETNVMYFAPGVVIKNIIHRDLESALALPPLGVSQDYTISGKVDYMISFDGGSTFTTGTSSSSSTIHLFHDTDSGATENFASEMYSFDFSGGDMPPGIIIRESPSFASSGITTARAVPGGCMLSSFFDVYFEISVDYGGSWSPSLTSPIHMRLYVPGESFFLVDNMLPANAYISKTGKTYQWSNGIRGKNFDLYSWSATIPPPSGSPVIDNFNSWLNFSYSTDGGSSWLPASGTVTNSVQITYNLLYGFTRYYSMEFLAMNVSGLPGGMQIRESPSKVSIGKHSIRLVSGGFNVCSFFDIFLEMSIDGGATWSPMLGPVRLELYTQARQIQANVVGNGTISPSGSVFVPYDADTTFTITADPGYTLTTLMVDGASVSPASSYTFSHVAEDHSITATFTPAAPVQITVGTVPQGPAFSVDGVPYTTQQTFSWIAGSTHTIAVESPQYFEAYTRYLLTGWSDGGASSHAVSPTTDGAYTASFITEYYLTCSADPGGTATPNFMGPEGDGFLDSGTTVRVTATPDPGYYFTAWRGTGNLGFSNPADIVMNGPTWETAGFSNVGHRLGFTAGWNMISIPYSMPNPHVEALFSHASSPAFHFTDHYVTAGTIENGLGYWQKFSEKESIDVYGAEHYIEYVTVKQGWNMIGSVSMPLVASLILSDPPAIVTGNFYEYDNGYHTTSTLLPGKGYWVKVDKDGTLILMNITAGASKAGGPITIVPTAEMPPAPPYDPSQGLESLSSGVPNSYKLEEAYPNPFNPSTTIRYQLPEASTVSLKVYNVLGQAVAALAGGVQEAGYRQVEWDASSMVSGIYFYRLDAVSIENSSSRISEMKKVVLIK